MGPDDALLRRWVPDDALLRRCVPDDALLRRWVPDYALLRKWAPDAALLHRWVPDDAMATLPIATNTSTGEKYYRYRLKAKQCIQEVCANNAMKNVRSESTCEHV